MENATVNIEIVGSEWHLDIELGYNFVVVSEIIAKSIIFHILSAVQYYIAKKQLVNVLCDRSHLSKWQFIFFSRSVTDNN